MHMYCTLSTSTSTVLSIYTVQYSTKCIIICCSAKFYLGGLAHCTVQSVSLFFARLNFIWGGLSTPKP